MLPLLPSFPKKESLVNSQEDRLKVQLVEEALDYWQEGIDLAIKSSASGASSAGSAAVSETRSLSLSPSQSAMCGPTAAAQWSPAGPGMETVTVASAAADAPPSSGPTSDTFENKLEKVPPLLSVSQHLSLDQDVDFAIAYATSLCNIAEASIALGSSDKAADSLSSALKALQAHEQRHSKASPTFAR
jgi:hypothetical protein